MKINIPELQKHSPSEGERRVRTVPYSSQP
jgi:hypothetical protein